jgi:hypothetical protein
VSFFQPQSNVQELLLVIQNMNTMADEQSAIPRYLTGESLSGGAGRTASGLSMLMNNAAKVLQTVAANVDTDVLEPILTGLYDMIMLTDTSGILTGEEEIRVKGSSVSAQRDTERQKQLQALQITANPIDAPIIGEIGRARLLRAVFEGMGLPDDIVPDDQTLQAQLDAQKRMQAAGQALVAHAQGQGIDPGQGAAGPIQGHRQVPPGAGGAAPGGQAGPGGQSPGSAAQGSQSPKPTPPRHSDYAPAVNAFSAGTGVPRG